MALIDPMFRRDGISIIRGKFNTHVQYAYCIEKHFNELQISCKLGQGNTNSLEQTPILRFMKLSHATHASLHFELTIIADNEEYARVAATWMPVKCYYAIYYLEAVALYLIDTRAIYFGNGGHSETLKGLRSQILSKQLIFSNSKVSEIHTHKELRSHTIASGANQRSRFYMEDECIISLQKMLSKYSEEGFKRSIGAEKGYRTHNSQLARDKFYNSEMRGLNLTEFFYWMRIKINYKDASYLDPVDNNEIPNQEIVSYLKSYYKGYDSYRQALENLITILLNQRAMSINF